MLWSILTDLFGISKYLHSVGTGDVQALEDLFKDMCWTRIDIIDDEERFSIAFGSALAVRAMCNLNDAIEAAAALYRHLEEVGFEVEALHYTDEDED